MVGVEVSYQAQGFTELARSMGRAALSFPDEIVLALDRAAKIVLLRAQDNLVRDNAVASGDLFDSLYIGASPGRRTVSSNARHAAAIERGVEPGAAYFSPDFTRWMIIRGIPLEAEFPVKRAIQRRGLPARPFLHPALEQSREDIEKEFVLMARRIKQQILKNTRPTRIGGSRRAR